MSNRCFSKHHSIGRLCDAIARLVVKESRCPVRNLDSIVSGEAHGDSCFVCKLLFGCCGFIDGDSYCHESESKGVKGV